LVASGVVLGRVVGAPVAVGGGQAGEQKSRSVWR